MGEPTVLQLLPGFVIIKTYPRDCWQQIYTGYIIGRIDQLIKKINNYATILKFTNRLIVTELAQQNVKHVLE